MKGHPLQTDGATKRENREATTDATKHAGEISEPLSKRQSRHAASPWQLGDALGFGFTVSSVLALNRGASATFPLTSVNMKKSQKQPDEYNRSEEELLAQL